MTTSTFSLLSSGRCLYGDGLPLGAMDPWGTSLLPLSPDSNPVHSAHANVASPNTKIPTCQPYSIDNSPATQSPRSSVSAASTDIGPSSSLSSFENQDTPMCRVLGSPSYNKFDYPLQQSTKDDQPPLLPSGEVLGQSPARPQTPALVVDRVVDGYPVPSNSALLSHSSVYPSTAYPVHLLDSDRLLSTSLSATTYMHQISPYLHTLGHVNKRIGRPRIDRSNTQCQRCGTRKTPQWRYLLRTPPVDNSSLLTVSADGSILPTVVPSTIIGHPTGKICLCNACWLRAHKERQRLRSHREVPLQAASYTRMSAASIVSSSPAPQFPYSTLMNPLDAATTAAAPMPTVGIQCHAPTNFKPFNSHLLTM